MKKRAAAKPAPGQSRQQIERLEARNRELARTLQIVEEARANLADQYDFAPVGFVTLDAKGCVREMNLTAARMLGCERSRLLTMPFLSHIAKPHIPIYLRHLRACRAGAGKLICEAALRVRGAAGGTVPVELLSVPVIDPRRGDIVFRTTITDITERLRAGRALRESEERYRDLVEYSPDGIFIILDGSIVFANRAAVRLTGVETMSDLLGHEFLDLVAPSFRRSVQTMLLEVSHSRGASMIEASMIEASMIEASMIEASMIEARLTRPSVIPLDVELSASVFRYEGDLAFRVVARDISRRKQAERHVLAISERERSSIGRDLHDGVCQSLVGAACLAEAQCNDLRRTNPKAAKEAAQIATLLRSCADEARRLAGGLCPVVMELHGLVAALQRLTVEVSGRSRVSCSLQCDDQLTVTDRTVAIHLYRIVQEAVGNAIRHGRAKSVLIQLAAENGRSMLCVEDDGKGLPARPKKTGMGLHTMRYRASIIGGSLDVRRKQPRGTVVTCTFPTHPETS